ncbi:hypothetical protein [Fusibacter sp. 3D3]|uniref:hypothetical protein n=1 Tax=Fusibacter sp. 3D3 TaxID=1048380 RepID=UPI00085338EE|nr:hypothetical protein [Fusibacter sp. 3D3]GAU77112.1 hypothetical protein F3D3_1711 [Fusibacter sp. 3D3]
MKIGLMVLGVFYGLIMLFTGALMFPQKRLGRLSSALMFVGGAVVIFAFVNKEMTLMMRALILGLGLISVHISAVMNGYKLYGKPLVKHHLIRACISVVLWVGCYGLY